MNPQPCAVAQPVVEMTEVAIGNLLDQIETGKPPTGRRRLFEPKLVVRGSTARGRRTGLDNPAPIPP